MLGFTVFQTSTGGYSELPFNPTYKERLLIADRY